jgi:hypothetical protein
MINYLNLAEHIKRNSFLLEKLNAQKEAKAQAKAQAKPRRKNSMRAAWRAAGITGIARKKRLNRRARRQAFLEQQSEPAFPSIYRSGNHYQPPPPPPEDEEKKK